MENARWGPIIKFNKKILKLSGKKYTAEEAALLSLDEVKAMIETQVPDAFKAKEKKTKAVTKKPAAKKSTSKKK